MILIIGVLAALAVPRFFSRVVFTERAYASELLQALRYARRSAEVANCSVAFAITSQGYGLYYNDACRSGGATSYTLPVPDPHELGQSLIRNDKPSTLIQNTTANTVVFWPQGGVTNVVGTPIAPVITLNGSEYSTSISIDGVTGYAKQN